MDPETVAKALMNDGRAKTLQLVLTEPKTATEAYVQYGKTYEDEKHRETIYRYLETLVDAGLVEKEYQSDRGLVYFTPNERLILDLEKWSVRSVDE